MYIVNIYSSCILIIKRGLWIELEVCKVRFSVGDWLFGGNFNVIWVESEKKSSSGVVNKREMEEFNEFIENLELVDPSTIGKKYTWFSLEGRSMSRLDRFLLSNGLIEAWKVGVKWQGLEIFRIIVPFGLNPILCIGVQNPLTSSIVGPITMSFFFLFREKLE